MAGASRSCGRRTQLLCLWILDWVVVALLWYATTMSFLQGTYIAHATIGLDSTYKIAGISGGPIAGKVNAYRTKLLYAYYAAAIELDSTYKIAGYSDGPIAGNQQLSQEAPLCVLWNRYRVHRYIPGVPHQRLHRILPSAQAGAICTQHMVDRLFCHLRPRLDHHIRSRVHWGCDMGPRRVCHQDKGRKLRGERWRQTLGSGSRHPPRHWPLEDYHARGQERRPAKRIKFWRNGGEGWRH